MPYKSCNKYWLDLSWYWWDHQSVHNLPNIGKVFFIHRIYNYTCAEIETMEKLWKTNNSHMWMGHWRWVGKLNMQQTPFHSLYKYATKNTYLIRSAILQSQDNIVISDWTSISLYCTPSVPRPPWSGHPGRHRDCWSYPPLYNVCNVQSNVSPGY